METLFFIRDPFSLAWISPTPIIIIPFEVPKLRSEALYLCPKPVDLAFRLCFGAL